ncbi:sialic acid-binding Ig-like lectin 9 [Colossoma macropomum]|uniref:sialic acid-binding Ig-like lectin 9 n=1 Tax=Colossoma macropomum TaxID=42526 RepID=UPI001864C1ED|nr:sialic acid-binding Ig-like lectin 9 [Colossoma macropomum]
MGRLLLLHVIFHGILFSGTWTWSVTMPGSIKGLYGSCLVIPCSYYYDSDPPTNPYRVVWFQYISRGYPLVYDSWNPGSVIDKFRWKTSLYGDPHMRDCSLLIEDLNLSHHGEKLYTWIDPENVGRSTYAFFDVTSTIYIETSAPAPSIDIFGGNQIGQQITVQCSTYHTCPHRKPTLTLSGIEGTQDRLEHTDIGGGTWKITLIRNGIVKSDNHRVDCVVRHPGGLSASATKTHTATCPIYSPQITPDSSTEFLEGVETDIICSVMYKCPRDRPYIRWNGGQLSGSMSLVPGAQQEARSTLKYTAWATDHGKVITCQVEFKASVQTVAITLKVKRDDAACKEIRCFAREFINTESIAQNLLTNTDGSHLSSVVTTSNHLAALKYRLLNDGSFARFHNATRGVGADAFQASFAVIEAILDKEKELLNRKTSE